MKNKNTTRPEKNKKVRRESDSLPWRYCLLILFLGVILAAGFFFAARQHFSAMDYGIKNAKLRRQKEDLESEQRRFRLAKEVALSPAEIKKAAQKIGFRDMSAANIQVFEKTEPAKPETSVAAKPKPSPAAAAKEKNVAAPPVTTAKKETDKKEKTNADADKKMKKTGDK